MFSTARTFKGLFSGRQRTLKEKKKEKRKKMYLW
jgi:hypothetical protein